ncbi:uncharacterized protein PSFLO_03375 [Pseudozyma flocculosa]|nr:uncharacterized protein PSFLO_03375 [Pseudozyma flocculosa]
MDVDVAKGLADRRPEASQPYPSAGDGSYFGLPSLTASPTTSPRLEADGLPLDGDRYPRDPPSLSISSSASTPNQDVAAPPSEDREGTLRRVATSLRLGIDDVRSVAQHYQAHLSFRYGPATTASSAMAQRIDPAVARMIVDALRQEEDRDSRVGAFREAYIQHSQYQHQHQHRHQHPHPPALRQHRHEPTCSDEKMVDPRPPPPPGQVWASDRNRSDWRSAPRQRPAHSHTFDEAPRDDRRRPHEPYAAQLAGPSQEGYRSILAGSASPRSSIAGDTVLSASPRSSSPSPFAFDPLRRPSLPPLSAMSLHEPTSAASNRSSLDSGASSPRQSWYSAAGSEALASPRLSYPSGLHAARKGRSIDDYLESASTSSRRVRRPNRTRDSLGLLPSELEGSALASSRHPFQPYPAVPGRHSNPLQLTQTQSWSPSGSPALAESPLHLVSGLPRRSQAAVASTSTFRGPSYQQAGAMSFTPSPSLGGHEQNLWGSPSIKSETSDSPRQLEFIGDGARRDASRERHGGLAAEQHPSRAVAETAAVAPTPAVAAGGPAKKPRGRAIRARTLASATTSGTSSESAPASSTSSPQPSTVAGPLSREEIMKRLQLKVKARLAAKEQGTATSSSPPEPSTKVGAAAAGKTAKAAKGVAGQR